MARMLLTAQPAAGVRIRRGKRARARAVIVAQQDVGGVGAGEKERGGGDGREHGDAQSTNCEEEEKGGREKGKVEGRNWRLAVILSARASRSHPVPAALLPLPDGVR